MREVALVCAVIVLGVGAYSLTAESVEDIWARDIASQKAFIQSLYEDHQAKNRQPATHSGD
jgi:hypothetical protein